MGQLGLPAMRRVATGTLVALVAFYLLTFSVSEPGWVTRLLRAAAGAGIVGALADWFAVVALFRHPLGVPIPHTALLPRNQERVADNVGRFIEEHFLQTDLVQTKLKESRLTAHVATWLLDDVRSESIVRSVFQHLATILRSEMPPELAATFAGLIRNAASKAAHSPKTAGEVSELLKQGFRGEALTEIIGFLKETVQENRRTVRGLVSDNSRWWIASRIDTNAAEMIVNGLVAVLDEVSDPDSALRLEFEAATATALQNVATQDRLRKVIGTSVEAYLGSTQIEAKASEAMVALQGHLANHLEDDAVVEAALEALRSAAQRMSSDVALQARIDTGIATFVSKLLPELRPHVGAFVAQTIKDWDPELLVERFETEAGPDLQFIRINGALMGFLIGGGLFVIEHAIG